MRDRLKSVTLVYVDASGKKGDLGEHQVDHGRAVDRFREHQIRKCPAGITATLTLGLSNGLTDSVYTKLRRLTRIANGFRSTDNLIALRRRCRFILAGIRICALEAGFSRRPCRRSTMRRGTRRRSRHWIRSRRGSPPLALAYQRDPCPDRVRSRHGCHVACASRRSMACVRAAEVLILGACPGQRRDGGWLVDRPPRVESDHTAGLVGLAAHHVEPEGEVQVVVDVRPVEVGDRRVQVVRTRQ